MCCSDNMFYFDEDGLMYANATINPLPEDSQGNVTGCISTDQGWKCNYGDNTSSGMGARIAPRATMSGTTSIRQGAPPPRSVGYSGPNIPKNAMNVEGSRIFVVPNQQNNPISPNQQFPRQEVPQSRYNMERMEPSYNDMRFLQNQPYYQNEQQYYQQQYYQQNNPQALNNILSALWSMMNEGY